jgi:ferredoxin
MPNVKVTDRNGNEKSVEVPVGTTLSEACERAGVDFQYSCGKGGWCSTCVVNVDEGKVGYPEDPETALTALDSEELDTCEKFGIEYPKQILSCSCQVMKDCSVSAPEF